MNKKMRELNAKIQTAIEEAKAFVNEEEKFNEKKEEIEALKKEYAAEEYIFESEKAMGTMDAIAPVEDHAETKKVEEVDAVAKFGHDAKLGFRLNKSVNETIGADGGYAVPEDIVAKIESYRESKASLLDLVRKVDVTTNKGARTFKKRSQHTGFTKVGEGGKIGAKATPQFERINFEIEKYAGYFPVTNEVLEDSDASLANVLIEWIGDESRTTANKLILEAIAEKTAVALDGLDGIKKALNVTLGQAFKATAKIVTNDDGLQYLDTLKDSTGRYLLAPMPGDTMAMALQVGATFVPVEVIPNADMPTEANKIPFIVGDLNEAVIYWNRKQMNIKLSDVAVVGDLNAYEEDLTLYRAIEREDVTLRDADAIVNGYILGE